MKPEVPLVPLVEPLMVQLMVPLIKTLLEPLMVPLNHYNGSYGSNGSSGRRDNKKLPFIWKFQQMDPMATFKWI